MMNIVIVKPANIYGVKGDFTDESGHVLPALIQRLNKLPMKYGEINVTLSEILHIQ